MLKTSTINAEPTSRQLSAARRFTRRLATSHYENFTVVSFLLPRRLHQDFYNIYAYCRHADDLADEIPDISQARQALARLRAGVRNLYLNQSPVVPLPPGDRDHPTCDQRHPPAEAAILTALGDTIRRHALPWQPLMDLISAFEQDRRINRYDTREQVLDYCTRSANPVGRLVLGLCGYHDEHRINLSNDICTALQLTNFWQDVRRDYVERNRIYVPREDMKQFGVTESDIASAHCTPAYRNLIRFQVDRAQELFDRGHALIRLIRAEVRADIALFSAGGQAILQRIRALDYDTLTTRPALGKVAKFTLILRAMTGKIG